MIKFELNCPKSTGCSPQSRRYSSDSTHQPHNGGTIDADGSQDGIRVDGNRDGVDLLEDGL